MTHKIFLHFLLIFKDEKMKTGFLLIDKEKDWTSFDVCARLRKRLNIKKIGHTGTLDPFATGLLIVAIGKGTKLIPFFEKDQKTYEAEILLGKTSETLDTESEIIESFDGKKPTQEEIESILKSNFLGKIKQIPPKYSALKIGGKKMCDLARAGKEFEIKERETEIFSTQILEYEFPVLKIKIEVSAGFYVRSFARDLGTVLCGGGLCQNLRRTSIEAISVDTAKIVNETTDEDLIDPRTLLNLPIIEIETDRLNDFSHGRAFIFPNSENFQKDEKYLVVCEDKTIGVCVFDCGNLQPRVVF